MDNNSLLDQDLSDDLEITPSVKIAFEKAFIWGKRLAIILYISSALMIFTFLNLATAETRSAAKGGQPFMIALFLTFIVCTFFSAYHLMGFGNRGIISLKANNNKILSVCFESLKSYFKFFGIFVSIIALFFGASMLLTILEVFS